MILIIDCGSNKTPDISGALSAISVENTVVGIKDLSVDKIAGLSGIIISGAPILVTQTDSRPYLEKLEFIKDLGVPVLGICFGHQILGMLFGAKPYRCRESRSPEKIKIMGESLIFDGIPVEEQFQQDHCEAIYLPEGFNHIARSATCGVEAMENPSKHLYGVQFHPEVSGEVGKKLIANFVRICQNHKV